MKTSLLIPTAVCGLCLFTACEYDEEYGGRRVTTVSSGASAYYGDYDEYAPYYAYSGRRYYQRDGRYVYYDNRRPYYVSSLPSAAAYTTPRRGTASVSVSTSPAYYGDYNESTPYYSYSGRRYYQRDGRYVYYDNRRPSYITTLPSAAVYINPTTSRSSTVTTVRRAHDRDREHDRD